MPRKLAIIIDTENGYTQMFKRRDVLVKVMGEVEKVLNYQNRIDKGLPAREGDLSLIAVRGGGVEGIWLDDVLAESFRDGRAAGYIDGYDMAALAESSLAEHNEEG